jgi:hypothetical protein
MYDFSHGVTSIGERLVKIFERKIFANVCCYAAIEFQKFRGTMNFKVRDQKIFFEILLGELIEYSAASKTKIPFYCHLEINGFIWQYGNLSKWPSECT